MNFSEMVYEASFGIYEQLPPSTYPEFVFSGRSNVGKSSLVNKICSRKVLARISSRPGKTITINFYKLGNVRFVDLPGYGYAKTSKGERKRWSEMIDQYFEAGRNVPLVVQLVDMRHSPTQDDIEMIGFLKQAGYPFIIALTKADKLRPQARKTREAELIEEFAALDIEEGVFFPTSSETGENIDELRKLIMDIAKDAPMK